MQSNLSSSQFGGTEHGDSELSLSEHTVHVQTGQTGLSNPRSQRVSLPGLGALNINTSGRRTNWENDHQTDDSGLAIPLPYDQASGGKSYRDFGNK